MSAILPLALAFCFSLNEAKTVKVVTLALIVTFYFTKTENRTKIIAFSKGAIFAQKMMKNCIPYALSQKVHKKIGTT